MLQGVSSVIWAAVLPPFKKAGGHPTNSKVKAAARKSEQRGDRLKAGWTLDFSFFVHRTNRD